MTKLSVAEVLERAADLIEPEGRWVQGHSSVIVGGKVCYCMIGAINAVARGDWQVLEARDVLCDVLPRVSLPVVTYNDAPERTQADVVAKLREAATLARSAGQ